MKRRILLFLLAFISISQYVGASDARNKYNFNSDWLLSVGDTPEAQQVRFQDTDWKKVTLPRAFNEDEAFRLSIDQLTDTVLINIQIIDAVRQWISFTVITQLIIDRTFSHINNIFLKKYITKSVCEI